MVRGRILWMLGRILEVVDGDGEVLCSILVNDTDIDFHYKTQLPIGDYQIGIPGLSVSVPVLGGAGVFLDVIIGGELSTSRN